MLDTIRKDAIKWSAALFLGVVLAFVLEILEYRHGRVRFEDEWFLSILGLTLISQAGLKVVRLSITKSQ